MLRALVVTVTSLFVAASSKDPLAPYVFVAGVEGTGHHWFTSFFGHCYAATKRDAVRTITIVRNMVGFHGESPARPTSRRRRHSPIGMIGNVSPQSRHMV